MIFTAGFVFLLKELSTIYGILYTLEFVKVRQ